jgi:hypothetical protein
MGGIEPSFTAPLSQHIVAAVKDFVAARVIG